MAKSCSQVDQVGSQGLIHGSDECGSGGVNWNRHPSGLPRYVLELAITVQDERARSPELTDAIAMTAAAVSACREHLTAQPEVERPSRKLPWRTFYLFAQTVLSLFALLE